MLRYLAFLPETVVYGISYAYLQFLIRSPKPLDPDWAWKDITRQAPAVLEWLRFNWPPRFLRRALISLKMKQDHVLGISEHYDVSNDFYELFLDWRYMFYSCADFHEPSDTLEEAQQHKADFILNLIDPQPGQKILELGCGWGAMLRRIHEQTGDKENLYGFTLSREQVAYNEQHNGFNVEFDDFITRDYQPEQFDVIYSIGAWEHVRPKEVLPLLQKLYGALKPGGRLVKHFFGPVNDALSSSATVAQIYFPGSMGTSLRRQMKAFEDAGFRIQHGSLHDYRPTLRAWHENLAANQDRAIELVGVRVFNRYITFFPASWKYFDDRIGVVQRWVLEKPS